jgi:hypothetical protein
MSELAKDCPKGLLDQMSLTPGTGATTTLVIIPLQLSPNDNVMTGGTCRFLSCVPGHSATKTAT